MTQKNCHTCKGVYTENQKKFYCNITGKKPNDANLLLKWYEDHEVTKPDLPCKDYAESISKQDAKHTPAGHAAHDPYGYYDNLCGFLQSWGYRYIDALLLISDLKRKHKEDHIFKIGDSLPLLLICNCGTYVKTMHYHSYSFPDNCFYQSNDLLSTYTKCKQVA